METQQAESVNTNVSNQKAVKPAKDSTNLVLGILCIILCAGIFALLYMYMNLNSEYQDLNDKYDQLVLADNTTSDDTNTNKEIDMADTTDSTESDTNNTTETKSFSFVLSSDTVNSSIKVTGEIPKGFTAKTKTMPGNTGGEISNSEVLITFGLAYEASAQTFPSYSLIKTNNFGTLAFVNSQDSFVNEKYELSGRYADVGESFDQTQACMSYGEKIDPPCGTEILSLSDNNNNLIGLIGVTCYTNSKSDFQTCHDIVKSIKFEEVN